MFAEASSLLHKQYSRIIKKFHTFASLCMPDVLYQIQKQLFLQYITIQYANKFAYLLELYTIPLND